MAQCSPEKSCRRTRLATGAKHTWPTNLPCEVTAIANPYRLQKLPACLQTVPQRWIAIKHCWVCLFLDGWPGHGPGHGPDMVGLSGGHGWAMDQAMARPWPGHGQAMAGSWLGHGRATAGHPLLDLESFLFSSRHGLRIGLWGCRTSPETFNRDSSLMAP